MHQYILAFLLATLGLLGCSQQMSGAPIGINDRVLILGDSISDGYGVGRDAAWIAQLEGLSGRTLINAGVSGDTTEGGLARLPALLAEHQPRHLIIELGGNDALRRMNLESTRQNINAMIALAREKNVQVILMAIPEISLFSAVTSNLSDAPLYLDTAQLQKIPLIDNALSEVLSDSALRLDQIHPNAQGHKMLAEKVFARMRALSLLP